MTRNLPHAPADPDRPTAAVIEENPRKIVIAFLLAIALYLGIGFGTLAQEKLAFDAVQADVMVDQTATALDA